MNKVSIIIINPKLYKICKLSTAIFTSFYNILRPKLFNFKFEDVLSSDDGDGFHSFNNIQQACQAIPSGV